MYISGWRQVIMLLSQQMGFVNGIYTHTMFFGKEEKKKIHKILFIHWSNKGRISNYVNVYKNNDFCSVRKSMDTLYDFQFD